MNIVLLGPPGAGKGTQAERMSERWSLPHVSTGDMFRAALARGTEMGLKARKYMEAGELVPDEVVEGIVADRLSEEDCREGFILDGFPRNIHQAEALDDFLGSRSREVDVVFNISADNETLVKRLSGRRVCRDCGANYHQVNNPPSVEGVCDSCGGEVYQRADDNEETVRKRLEVYDKQTKPLIVYYSQAGKLVDIDGSASPEEVFSEISNRIEEARER